MDYLEHLSIDFGTFWNFWNTNFLANVLANVLEHRTFYPLFTSFYLFLPLFTSFFKEYSTFFLF